MRKYDTWIYDSESGCEQPIRCEAKNERDAIRKGNEYIKAWRLSNGTVTRVKEAEEC